MVIGGGVVERGAVSDAGVGSGDVLHAGSAAQAVSTAQTTTSLAVEMAAQTGESVLHIAHGTLLHT